MTLRGRVLHLIARPSQGGAEEQTLATIRGLNDYECTVGYDAEYAEEQVTRLETNGIDTKQFQLIRHYNL